ncbi:fumarylacetoacetate hydrolase family protein [Variovorax sp. J22P271]|uniref:2-keto-4-pentenoate hydratase n=1 Tax=Variovorax davisae TaxID=3053515 RepID=UPI0025750462|nr:fumarylacetoacetate hydrolase family protein [Variovorax sp. J22P271]MDM0032395.1 fumarylacetoacetate hydrolase family protein [Variovorax sp. J22P271]
MHEEDGMSTPQTLLDRLVAARREHRQIDDLSADELPASLDAAYAIADRLVAAMSWRAAGYKVGANTQRAQRMLGLDEPLSGRVLAHSLWSGRATYRTFGQRPDIEAELVLRLARALPDPQAMTDAELRDAIDCVMLGAEINQPSYRDAIALGGAAIVADNGAHAGLLLGRPRPVAQLDSLVGISASLHADGVRIASRSAVDAGVAPLAALRWLANDRARRGSPLCAGEVVATGAIAMGASFQARQRIEVSLDEGVELVIDLSS